MTCRQPKNRLAYEMHVMLSATCCPPSALFCCVCPVVHVVGGSHGAVTPRVERSFASRLRLSSASAAAGLARLGLLLWRSSGAPEHCSCAVSAFGAALLRAPGRIAFARASVRTASRSFSRRVCAGGQHLEQTLRQSFCASSSMTGAGRARSRAKMRACLERAFQWLYGVVLRQRFRSGVRSRRKYQRSRGSEGAGGHSLDGALGPP
jgi:hypothetical protein